MGTKYRLLILELLVTIGMVLCAVWMFPSSVISFRPEVTLLVALGLSFSVFRMNRINEWQHIAAPAAIAAICAWMIYVIFSSALAYRDLVIMVLQGLIFIEVALSFTLCGSAFMGYVQALSMPLFMAHALFVRDYPLVSLILIVCYLVLTGLAMRFKLSVNAQQGQGAVFTHAISFILPAVIIIVGIPLGRLLSGLIPLPKIAHAGALFSSEEGSGQGSEKDYYEKQSRLQKENTDLILDLKSKDRRIESFEDLNNLVKESPLTIDADRGEEGLISLLHTPGAGLDPVELEKRKHLTSSYCDSKAKFEQQRSQAKLAQTLQDDPLNVPARMSVMNHANRIRQAQSLEDIQRLSSPQEKVQDLSMDKRKKSDIAEQLDRLQEWKLYEIYRKDLAYLSAKEQGAHGKAGAGLREMIDGIKAAGTLADVRAVQEKIDAGRSGGDFHGVDIGDKLQEALDIKSHMILAGQARRAKADVRDNPDISVYEQDQMLKRIDEAAQIRRMTGKQDTRREEKTPTTFIPYQKNAAVALVSLSVVPPVITLGRGDEAVSPLVIGTADDGSQWNVSDLVAWRSSDAGVADIISGRLSARAVGEARINAFYQLIESSPLHVTVEKPKLVSIIAKASREKGDLRDVFTLTASGVSSDGSREDLTAKAEWVLSDPRAFRVEESRAYPLRLGGIILRARYEGIQSQPVRIEVVASLRWILGIVFSVILAVLAAALPVISLLLYLTNLKKKALHKKRSDPREYLIALYETIRHIFYIAGMKEYANMPYRHFVQQAHEQTAVPYELLLKMTDAYEEARFSAHAISESSVLTAAGQYNQVLQSLLTRGAAVYRIRLAFMLLFHRFPFFL